MSGKENNVRDIDHEIEQSMKPMRSRAGLGVAAAAFLSVAGAIGIGAVIKQNANNHEDTKDCLREALLYKAATHAALSEEGLACYDDEGEKLGDLFIRSATHTFGDTPSIALEVRIEYAQGVSTKDAAAQLHTLEQGTQLYDKVSENILSYTAE
ncbi:MAG: hypothetical protein CL570_07105 [Alphaproteobacteria bacterium]|nr:hypothetical protein [Alphaproteobacteria bacterium]